MSPQASLKLQLGLGLACLLGLLTGIYLPGSDQQASLPVSESLNRPSGSQVLPVTDRLFNEAERLLRQGQNQQALQRYQQLIGLEPEQPFAYYEAAKVHRLLGQPDEAMHQLDQALRLALRQTRPEPQLLGWLYEEQALLLARRGVCEDARKASEQACVYSGLPADQCSHNLYQPDCDVSETPALNALNL